jgi:hypothetical protein
MASDIARLAQERRGLLRDIRFEESQPPSRDRDVMLTTLYLDFDKANLAYVAAVNRVSA